jgi:hypothetical protein
MIQSGFGYDTESYATKEYPIPADGIIRLAYIPPIPNIEDNEVLGIGRKTTEWAYSIKKSRVTVSFLNPESLPVAPTRFVILQKPSIEI